MAAEKYSSKQLRLLIACFIAYTGAYISRTNLSPAMDAIQTHFGLTAAQIGLLPTLFAIPYAAGQVINGMLADRFKARSYIFTGLTGSAVINIVFSFSRSYHLLLLLWCLNGCFQSMLWTPIIKIFAQDFQPSNRDRALFQMSMTLIVGYLCAWALSGLLVSALSWQAAFRTSGLVTMAMALAAFHAMRDHEDMKTPKASVAEGPRMSVRQLLLRTDLMLVLVCCMFNGYVRDSIMNWAPKMIVDTQGIDLSSALGVVLIIPMINFLGIQSGRAMYQHLGRNVRSAVMALMLCCVVSALALMLTYSLSPWLCTLFLALCSALAYSLNPLLTSIVPMDYSATGRIALVAGLADAAIYAGSAFSGVLTGVLQDWLGWRAVFGSWAFFSCIGVAVMAVTVLQRRAHPGHGSE